jgi:hypothetical protein
MFQCSLAFIVSLENLNVEQLALKLAGTGLEFQRRMIQVQQIVQ